MSLSGKGAGTVSSDGFIDAGTYSIDAASFCEDHFQPLPDAPHKVVVAAQRSGSWPTTAAPGGPCKSPTRRGPLEGPAANGDTGDGPSIRPSARPSEVGACAP